jgi:hypothetical protein
MQERNKATFLIHSFLPLFFDTFERETKSSLDDKDNGEREAQNTGDRRR